ncbi:MAG: DinB family protein [Cyclobacteriaceae bacterium]
MKSQIELLRTTRHNIISVMDACSTEQLFSIPGPFNNHILWNAMHLIATQQLLVYKNSNTAFAIDSSIVEQFKKGTAPDSTNDSSLIDSTKKQLISTLDQMLNDYNNGIFGAYNAITTSYGVTINTVEEAITFLNLHESMHLGQIKMLSKLV